MHRYPTAQRPRRRRILSVVLGFTAAMLAGTVIEAQPAALTLQQAEQMALQNHPQIQAAIF